MPNYNKNNITKIDIIKPNRSIFQVDTEIFQSAIFRAHKTLDHFVEFEVNVFELLGMRNLSAFIGEIYCAALIKETNGTFVKNPHQDGYPDLLLMDKPGKLLWEELIRRRQDKEPFSPFKQGGLEIKATCGSVPTPAQCEKIGLKKPIIGEQRIQLMRGYDWKAHHRSTNNLVGIIWDFIDNVPRIVAVFYSSSLNHNDWGEVIQPKEDGGRTTSVSIMNRKGVYKMYQGWLLVLKDDKYISFLNKYNKDLLIK